MTEFGIDCMKYRKSTHLALVDIEAVISEKKQCIVTIEKSYYNTGVDVSGKKLDGYFIKFKEFEKELMVNSTNRKTIANIAKNIKNLDSIASRNIGNWINLTIELIADQNVKMKGEVVGGIRIKSESPIPKISDENAKFILNASNTIDELKANWSKLTKQEQSLPSIISLKETLKTNLTPKQND